jgi:hypothetical protein
LDLIIYRKQLLTEVNTALNVIVQVWVAEVQELLQKKKCKCCYWVLGWVACKKEHGSCTELLREPAAKEGRGFTLIQIMSPVA